MLYELFCASRASCSRITSNIYLDLVSGAVKQLNDTRHSDQTTKQYYAKLKRLLLSPNFAIDHKLTAKFAQTLGEAQFYSMCLDRDVRLERIPEKNKKTPDFRINYPDVAVHFEVKTPSVVDGDIGIKKTLEDGMDAMINMEAQFKKGQQVASSYSFIQPYGQLADYHRPTMTVINTLLNKFNQNFKPGQFAFENTFLVLNLSLLSPTSTENDILRPAYCHCWSFPTPLSGDLWMLAFGDHGMLIHRHPAFEGDPCVEGFLNSKGILLDQQYSSVAGIIFMVHPWNAPTKLWGLFRKNNDSASLKWSPNVHKTISPLVTTNWNDEFDTNGWQLHEGLLRNRNMNILE